MPRRSRRARQTSNASRPYSLTWAHFRTANNTSFTSSGNSPGASQCCSGPMMREECSKDPAFPDPQKINDIQTITGPQ